MCRGKKIHKKWMKEYLFLKFDCLSNVNITIWPNWTIFPSIIKLRNSNCLSCISVKMDYGWEHINSFSKTYRIFFWWILNLKKSTLLPFYLLTTHFTVSSKDSLRVTFLWPAHFKKLVNNTVFCLFYTFFVELYDKNFPFAILHKPTKFHYQTVFTYKAIQQKVFLVSFFRFLWSHERVKNSKIWISQERKELLTWNKK